MQKKQSLRRLMRYAGSYRLLTVIGCVLSGIAAAGILLPFVCIWFAGREIIRSLITAQQADAAQAVSWGWTALWCALASMLVYLAALLCTHLAAFRTARNIRVQAGSHLLTLPISYFSSHESGRLRKIIDDNAALTEQLLAHELPDLVGAIVTPAACIVLLCVFDWRMGVLCLIPLILAAVILGGMMGGKNAGFFHKYQTALEDMSSQAVEYVRGMPVVKVFQQTVYSFKRFHDSIRRYASLASSYAMSCCRPYTLFYTILNGAFIILIPSGMALIQAAPDGWHVFLDFLFYILFTPACALMLMRIMYASEAIMQADEAVEKLSVIFSAKPLTRTASPQKPQQFDIAFSGVSYTYPQAAEPAVKNISLYFPQGKTTALVGPSGGGKSTLAALIPRFQEAQQGHIRIGGIDVADIAPQQLMSITACVFQNTRLFKTSIYENIRAGKPSASRAEILAAADAAQCMDIISKLPDGIDTGIGAHGVYLSGGEQQRIAIARAILKDAPIIILDEATAFADPDNEYRIQKSFEALTKNKTVVLIAHRLSTVRNADSIAVIAHGAVAEQGTHDELLAKNGVYAAMWNEYTCAAQWKAVNGGTQ